MSSNVKFASRSFDEADIGMALNQSSFQFITSLADLFGNFTNKSIQHIQYNFDHNTSADNFNWSQDDQDECACLLDCHDLVLQQIRIEDSKYLNFFKSILLDRNLSIEYISNIAVIPLFDILSKETDARAFEFETGGGSGLGFQLYCDDEIIMTAGAGGGGGIARSRDYSSNDSTRPFPLVSDNNYRISAGAGGGGGVQFLADFGEHGKRSSMAPTSSSSSNSSSSSSLWYSAGGGGGCGTCWNNQREYGHRDACYLNSIPVDVNTQYLRSTSMICGFTRDDDSLHHRQFEKILAETYSHEAFSQQCHRVTIKGGGGGGGGTGSCCDGYHFGYGFNFEITLSSHALDMQETTIKLDDKGSYMADGLSSRYRHDFIGRLLNEVSTSAGCSNRPDHWCCVCKQFQSRIDYCLSLDSPSQSTSPFYTPPPSMMNGIAWSDPSWHPLNITCAELREHQRYMAWLTPRSQCQQQQTGHYQSVDDDLSAISDPDLANNSSASASILWHWSLSDRFSSSLDHSYFHVYKNSREDATQAETIDYMTYIQSSLAAKSEPSISLDNDSAASMRYIPCIASPSSDVGVYQAPANSINSGGYLQSRGDHMSSYAHRKGGEEMLMYVSVVALCSLAFTFFAIIRRVTKRLSASSSDSWRDYLPLPGSVDATSSELQALQSLISRAHTTSEFPRSAELESNRSASGVYGSYNTYDAYG